MAAQDNENESDDSKSMSAFCNAKCPYCPGECNQTGGPNHEGDHECNWNTSHHWPHG